MDAPTDPDVVTARGVPMRRLVDPDQLRALAHPRRVELVDLLVERGPLTASQCAEVLGDSPASCSYHLRQLARFGFVEEAPGGTGRQRPWRWVPVGNRIERGDAAAQQEAADALLSVFDARSMHRLANWRARAATDPWEDIGGTSDWVFHLTEDETRGLSDALDELLTPYRRRMFAGERPPGSRAVDFQVFLLPRADGPDA